MFLLDDIAIDPTAVRNTGPRALRSVTLAGPTKYRRICISNWTNMELLTSPTYRGTNLLVRDGVMGKSLIVPRALRSAIVCNCDNSGPIVLGPVQEFVLLRYVRNTTLSVICPRVRLECCENLILFVNTQTPIIIAGNCRNIRLAPYNVFYDVINFTFIFDIFFWMLGFIL